MTWRRSAASWVFSFVAAAGSRVAVAVPIEGQGAELDFVRAQLTIESCLAGLAAPIEGVTVDIKSPEALE